MLSKTLKKILVISLLVSLVTTLTVQAVSAQEINIKEEAGVGEMMFDSLILRPIGMVSILVGSGLFLISMPFTAAFQGDIRKSFDLMVVKPSIYTFKRPLGKIN